jgi:hypothetical protein
MTDRSKTLAALSTGSKLLLACLILHGFVAVDCQVDVLDGQSIDFNTGGAPIGRVPRGARIRHEPVPIMLIQLSRVDVGIREMSELTQVRDGSKRGYIAFGSRVL